MKYLIIHKSNAASEAGVRPTPEFLKKMGNFMAEERQAGVLLQAEGALPSSLGARITFDQGQPSITDGPFAEAKEVIAGFAVVRAANKEEAIATALRFAAMFPPGEEPNLEVRLVYDPADFPPGQ